MTAIEEAAFVLREWHPPDDERIWRIARRSKLGNPELMSREELDVMVDAYYLRWAASIADSFLAKLNDQEIKLRLMIDESKLLEVPAAGAVDEDGEPIDVAAWRAWLEESLSLTKAEIARRAAGIRATRAPGSPRATPRVWSNER